MTYQLGIDVGTTSVVAAVRRADGSGAGDRAEVVPLGGGGPGVPCALHVARDGGVTVGEGALRLAGIDPSRVVRALPRHVGGPAPAGGGAWTADDLFARLVRWVVDRVAEREGGPAARVVLAHPVWWAVGTLDRLAAALAGVGAPVAWTAEPVAVVHAVCAGGGPGGAVAVYDLGGDRFDATVVGRADAAGGPGFAVLGRPEGLPDAGAAIDDLVWQHVRAGLPRGVVPDARVRRACLRAKEALSTRTEVVVRVRQGELRGEVRLDRGTFEGLIAPLVDRTAAALRRALDSAGLGPGEQAAVVLVGGSARIPTVTRAVSAELGRAVTLLDDPELVVARGAALAVPAAVASATGTAVRGTGAPVTGTAVRSTAAPGAGAAVTAVSGTGTAASATAAPVLPTLDTAAGAPAEPDPPARAAEPADMAAGPAPVPAEPAAVPAAFAAEAPVPAAVAPEPARAPAGRGDAAPGGAVRVPEPESVPSPLPAPPAPRRAVPVRTPAVLEGGARRGARSRSLPRLLLGAGAVAVAALVLVALFRPDGPLDPPLDVTGNVPRVTGAATVPPPVPTPTPPAAVVEGVRVDGAPVAARVTAPPPPRTSDRRPPVERPPVDRPAAVRPPVDTTPPAAPNVRTTGPGPAVRGTAAGAGSPPVGAAPRTPPTPAAPVA
jgi:hypothetical protein